MAKVNKLSHDSKVAEISTASNEMRALYGELEPNLGSDLYLKSLYEKYTPLSIGISEAIKKDQAESDLDERDGARDTCIRNIFFVVKGAAHNPIPSINDAGNKVLIVLEKYGLAIVDESYSIESAHVRSMLADLSTGEMEDIIGEIAGLEQLINLLKAAQNEFEAARSALDNVHSAEKGSTSATDIKKEIIAHVNGELVGYLRAMAMANPTMYGEFVRRTAEIIHRNNLQVKKRTK